MRKRNHKYPTGQLVRILNTPYVAERVRGKYAYVLSHANASSVLIGYDEPEYDIIIQGIPDRKCRVFQKEIQEVE
jgi:hypothetical protein